MRARGPRPPMPCSAPLPAGETQLHPSRILPAVAAAAVLSLGSCRYVAMMHDRPDLQLIYWSHEAAGRAPGTVTAHNPLVTLGHGALAPPQPERAYRSRPRLAGALPGGDEALSALEPRRRRCGEVRPSCLPSCAAGAAIARFGGLGHTSNQVA